MILITNDDGYRSYGLNILYKAAKSVFKGERIAVVAPDRPQSASGLSFTFHKPLRVDRLIHRDMPCMTVSGTPGDCVFISAKKLFKGMKIRMILAGLNHGINVSAEGLYVSGTVSAALWGAIWGMQSIAFSKMLSSEWSEERVEKSMNDTIPKLRFLLKRIANRGFPDSADILNVNFPLSVNKKTGLEVVKAERNVFDDRVMTKSDPSGKEYYWLYGTIKKKASKGTDLHAVRNGKITVTPLQFMLNEGKLEEIKRIFD